MKLDWLLELAAAEFATPASEGVAAGAAETSDAHGRTATTADEVPHLPHLPHLSGSDGGKRADLREHLTERAGILEYDAGFDRKRADELAVRIVQCSTCQHWTPDPRGHGGVGTCATGEDSRSWSAWDRRPLSAWPHAPRYCADWSDTQDGAVGVP